MRSRLVLAAAAVLLAGCTGEPQKPAAEKALEDLAYAQAKHFHQHGVYAVSVVELGGAGYQPVPGVIVSVQSENPETGYTATAEGGGGDVTCRLDHGSPGPGAEPYGNVIRCD